MGKAKTPRPEGPCHLCGVHSLLSFEHVPPEAAFNKWPVVRATREQILSSEDFTGEGGVPERRGSGAYTLCETCNSFTGGCYGAEYASWARQGFERLYRMRNDAYHSIELPSYVPFRGFPLRFLKQVVTLFFSVNPSGFRRDHPDLERFVRDRRATGLDPKYRVDVWLVQGFKARSSGITGMTSLGGGVVDIRSEVAFPPFGLQLRIGETSEARYGTIEHFANMGYSEEREAWLYTRAGYVNTKLPGDYRSRDQLEKDRRRNEEDG